MNMQLDKVNIAVKNVKKLYAEMTLKDLKVLMVILVIYFYSHTVKSQQLLWRFRHIDKDRDGLLSYREFAHSLRY